MKTYKTTFTVNRLWQILSLSLIVSFTFLLFFGRQIYLKAPPIPENIATAGSVIVYSRDDIERGQNIGQSLDGRAGVGTCSWRYRLRNWCIRLCGVCLSGV